MVQVFGTVERSETQDNKQITVFRIPAFSEGMARRRAKSNARIKDFDNPRVAGSESMGTADIPGQALYDVTIVSER